MSGRKAKQARNEEKQPLGSPRRHRLTDHRVAYIVATAATVVAVVGGLAIANERGASAEALSVNGISRADSGALSIHGRDPITGKQVSLAQFPGRRLVLNVWASWCTGCNQEAADLARFAAVHRRVQVLGVDTQDTTAGARGSIASGAGITRASPTRTGRSARGWR